MRTCWTVTDDEDDDEDAPEIEDHYNDPDEDDDAFDDDKLTEESYRTTFEDPENLGLDDAEDVADDDYLTTGVQKGIYTLL